MPSQRAMDVSAPSTHDADTDEALSERPEDARMHRRRHAASLPSSPAIGPSSPMQISNGQMHSSAPSSPGTLSPTGGAGPRASRLHLSSGCLLPSAASYPSSLRAGGRLFHLPPHPGSGLQPPMRTSPPKRDLASEMKHAKHAALLQAASLAVARIESAGELTPQSPGTGTAMREWHTIGSEYLGREIMRCVYDGASLAGMARATVIGWLPESESAFDDALGRPQALWRVRFCSGSLLEGEEETLERHELVDSIDGQHALAALEHGEQRLADGSGLSGEDEAEADGEAGWLREKRQHLEARAHLPGAHPHHAYPGVGAHSYGQAASGGAPEGAASGDEGERAQGGGGHGQPGGRRGKRRCGQCSTCKAEDCNQCKFCKDKAKNGGANTLRRPCSARMPCLAPPHDEPASAPLHSATADAANGLNLHLHAYEPTAIVTE